LRFRTKLLEEGERGEKKTYRLELIKEVPRRRNLGLNYLGNRSKAQLLQEVKKRD